MRLRDAHYREDKIGTAPRHFAKTPASSRKFCMLVYKPAPARPGAKDASPVLLAIRTGVSSLTVMVSPGLGEMVSGEHLLYIHDWLSNLAATAKRYPDLAFAQLSSMNSGPIVTSKVGRLDDSEFEFLSTCAHFLDLDVYHVSQVLPAHSAVIN